MPVEIRTLTAADVEPWIRAVRWGFLQTASEAEVDARRADIDDVRTLGCFDEGRVVGTLRSFASDLVVPGGGRMATSALTNVTVGATHRRRGLLTAMITRDLGESRERGEVLATLIAAEYPIYGRFGYGPAADSIELVVDAHAPFHEAAGPGRVTLVEPASVRPMLPALFEQARSHWPGALARSARWWDIVLGLAPYPGRTGDAPSHVAVGHDGNGNPDGWVIYTTTDRWERNRPAGILHVDDLIGIDDDATARLWRYCMEMDWIATVRAEDRPVDDLLPSLLVDARQAFQARRGDLEWVRLLDPAAALAGRAYLCEGMLTLEIVDPMGLSSARVRIDGGPEGASCRPTTASADLVLPIDVVSAIYLGGPTLASVARRGGAIDECTPGALARADAMFRGFGPPWCTHDF